MRTYARTSLRPTRVNLSGNRRVDVFQAPLRSSTSQRGDDLRGLKSVSMKSIRAELSTTF